MTRDEILNKLDVLIKVARTKGVEELIPIVNSIRASLLETPISPSRLDARITDLEERLKEIKNRGHGA